MGSCMGRALLKDKIIYLNPAIPLHCDGIKVGSGTYELKDNLKLKEGEQYFLTLLHEIGHFRIKKKPLLEWIKLKRKLTRKAKEMLRIERIRDKNFGHKPRTKKEEKRYILEYIHYNADGALEPKKGESDSYYLGRSEDFRDWLLGDMTSEHISVEDWARKEFKKQRKKIRKILAES